MKLIREFTSIQDLDILSEENGEGCKKVKKYFIKGPFMVAETRNKNGRVYPKETMKKAVDTYVNEYVKTNRAISELDHPESPVVSLKNASHIITELGFKGEDDNVVYGTARLLDPDCFPMAKIAMGFIKEGIIMGISSRGIGNLKENNIVDESYILLAIDLVLSPSGPNCFVEGILEGKEWKVEGNQIVEQAVQNLRDKVDKKYESKLAYNYLMEFLEDIKND